MNSFEPQLSIADEKRQASTEATRLRDASIDDARLDSSQVVSPQPLSITWSGRYVSQNVRTAFPVMICDQIVLLGTVWLAGWTVRLFGAPSPGISSAAGLFLPAGVLIVFAMSRLYPGVGLSTGIETRRCIVNLGLVFLVFLLASFAFQAPSESLGALIVAGILSVILVPVGRYATRRVFGSFRWWTHPVLVFGDGRASRTLVRQLDTHPQFGLSPVGILGDIRLHWLGDDAGECYLGPPDAAAKIRRDHGVFRAIVTMPEHPAVESHNTVALCAELFPHITVVSASKYRRSLVGERDWAFQDYSGFEYRSRHLSPLPHWAKRAMDLLLVLVVAFVAAPLILAIAAAVKLSSSGPILFAQERIGRGGRRFRLWKFRTMLPDAEKILDDYLQGHPELRQQWETEHKIENDPRVIPSIGRFLRKSSLDELPQLWNVLRGDMSLVGPRPLPTYHLEQFEPQFCRYREKMAPGITGLWQVASRSDGRPEMFVKWDSDYIQDWSLMLDVTILLRTIKVVLLGTGAC